MQRQLCVLLGLVLVTAGCDYNVTLPSPVVTVTTSNTSTNTNTQAVTFDLHDLVTFAPIPTATTTDPGATPTDDAPFAVPTAAEAIAAKVAKGNAALLARACHDWDFLDLVVTTLRQGDPRWGYVCKDSTCHELSRDTIGYRATTDDVGLWAVDVVRDQCGAAPAFAWMVLGFDPAARWVAHR